MGVQGKTGGGTCHPDWGGGVRGKGGGSLACQPPSRARSHLSYHSIVMVAIHSRYVFQQHKGGSSTTQSNVLITGQTHRAASQEQAGSQQNPLLGTAGVQQWVHEGSKWHTALPQQHGGRDDDSSELRRRMSELAGVTHICDAVLHPALVLTTKVCRLVGRM